MGKRLLFFLVRTILLAFQNGHCIWRSDRLPSDPPENILEKTQRSSLERSLSWTGSARPCEATAGSHRACQHLHMSVMILRRSHQVREWLSQGSQAPHPSQPTFPGPLPSSCTRIFGICRSQAASLPLPQNVLLPCLESPSCLLDLKQTPAYPSRPSSSHLLHEAFSDLPQADWTGPPLSPLSVL